jgi:pyruvate dehydrogenase E1 component
MKKMTLEDLKLFRDELRIPIEDKALEENPYLPPYYHPGPDASEIQYMAERRRQLGGFVPERRTKSATTLVLPGDQVYDVVRRGSGKQEIATTMAFVRLVRDLAKDPNIGARLVPIIPDEARTFGMDSMFPKEKIYNPHGQAYTSVDARLMLAYKESEQGQILHEGINEAGSAASFTAAGSSYATHGEPMVPIYIFYSMFGFQRTGDSLWAAADQMARGFVIGATAGRTTLTGEGMQHADGHSLLLAATNPAVVAYDPAWSFEIAHIVKDGLRRMYGDQPENVFYYLTVYNEPYVQAPEPENLDVEGLLRGLYRYAPAPDGDGPLARILVAGVTMPDALRAQDMLATEWGVRAEVWSATSWSELRREAVEIDRHNLLHPGAEPRVPYVTTVLGANDAPIVAVSDWMRAVPDLIRPWVPGDFTTLGTDGFGFSDTRPAARRYFLVDAQSITVAVLVSLAKRGAVSPLAPVDAATRYRIDDVQAAGPQTSDSGAA